MAERGHDCARAGARVKGPARTSAFFLTLVLESSGAAHAAIRFSLPSACNARWPALSATPDAVGGKRCHQTLRPNVHRMTIRSGYGRSLLFSLLFLAALQAVAGEVAATSRYFVTSDGVRLHYLETGRGPTLVFVPGWGMPAEIWAPQLRHFGQRYRAVAFDPRGQGRSAVPVNGYNAARRAADIKELIEALQAPSVVLVGWSLGVLESLVYVNEYGVDRLSALVLVDNSVGEEPPPVADPTFFDRLRTSREATVERFVRAMTRGPQPETYYRRIVESALRMPLDASIALLSYPHPREFWRRVVHVVDRPVLYAVSPRFAEQALNLKRHRPAVRIQVFENAGHALFVDEPDGFNELLDEFLREHIHP